MKTAALIENDRVIGEVFDAPEKGNTIEVAGAFTASGDPVNVKTFKISRSKVNVDKAQYERGLTKIGSIWTYY